MVEQVKVAYVFPGQSSWAVGMGLDIFLHYASAREVFDEVDRVLGFPLSRLCFEGPEEELIQTFNVQPAVLTTSIACLKAAQEVSGESIPAATFLAGHGLGEYAALVAGNAVSLADAVCLVRERGRLMHEAGRRKPGGMLTIVGLEQGIVEYICLNTGTTISNINSPSQIVISGAEDNLTKAWRLARTKGARRITPLKVSGAFYSPMMEPATAGLSEATSSFTFRDSSVPIVANVTAQPVTDVKSIKEELVSQLYRCIQWRDSIENMIARGVTNFFEIGHGEVLTGLIKQISPGVRTFNVGDLTSVREIAKWRRM